MVKQDTHNVLNKGSNPFKLIFTKILYFIIINIKFVSYQQLKLKEIMMLLAPKRSKYKTIFIRKSLSNKAKSPILNFGLLLTAKKRKAIVCPFQTVLKLDPVGSTVRYEMMKL